MRVSTSGLPLRCKVSDERHRMPCILRYNVILSTRNRIGLGPSYLNVVHGAMQSLRMDVDLAHTSKTDKEEKTKRSLRLVR